MKFRKAQWLIGYTILAMILSSCNLGATPVPTQDVGVIQTQAFEKVLTQVALASSPTPLPTDTPAPTSTLSAPPTFAAIGGSTINTPFPFNTPQAGLTPLALSPVPTLAGMVPTITTENGCNNGAFISESAPYDGQVIDPSKPYEKSFTLMNTGACTWDEGYAFIFQPNYSTEGFKGSDILLKKTVDSTPTGDTITFVMKLTASHLPGEYIGSWKMRDDGGNYFGPLVYVKYIIGTPEEQASIKATAKAATAAADED
jgi:hypothetical protein